MNNDEEHKNWLSAHIYFNGNIYEPGCDKVILDIVAPFISICKKQDLFEKYFFIRYSEFGSHVRLRFYSKQTYLDIIKQMLDKNISGYSDQDILVLPLNLDQHIISNSPLFWTSYEPELNRYGGTEAIRIAEEFFYYSSETAVKLIKKIPDGEYSSRLGKGLLSMVILLYTFIKDRNRAMDFIENYGNNYLKVLAGNEEIKKSYTEAFNNGFDIQSQTLIGYTNIIWQSLQDKNSLSEDLDEYRKYLTKISEKLKNLSLNGNVYKNNNVILDWQNCIKMIIPSYIHMMNNRLGISIKDESYLSYLIAKSLKIKHEMEYEIEND